MSNVPSELRDDIPTFDDQPSSRGHGPIDWTGLTSVRTAKSALEIGTIVGLALAIFFGLEAILRWTETPGECAARELAEETGLISLGLRDAHVQRSFPILPAWRSRYAPGVDSNVEHQWYLEVPEVRAVQIEPGEHVAYLWLPIDGAIEKVASWTNREALQRLKDSRRA